MPEPAAASCVRWRCHERSLTELRVGSAARGPSRAKPRRQVELLIGAGRLSPNSIS